MNKIISKNTERFIQKMKNDQLQLYIASTNGSNFTRDIAYDDYMIYKNFLKTGLFHWIAYKHIVCRKKLWISSKFLSCDRGTGLLSHFFTLGTVPKVKKLAESDCKELMYWEKVYGFW